MSATLWTLPFDQPRPLEPPPAYAQLRADAPVASVLGPEGQPACLVTSYDAVARVLSDSRFGLMPPGTELPSDAPVWDGQPHARLRRLVAKAFTPRAVAALRPRVDQLAMHRVAAITASEAPADLVADLAAPLSITVISDILGVDVDDRAHFRDLAAAASAADPFALDAGEDAIAAWAAFSEYAATLVAAKNADPGEDLLSALIAVRDADDGRLRDGELVTLVTIIVASGYLTACNAISVGAMQLMTEGRLAAAATESESEFDQTVEEVLRLQAGLTGEPFPRWAHEDLRLGGVTISAGDRVLVRLAAANRDPAHFLEPDRLHPGRRSSPPLTFGRGPHHCLGAALARLEVGAALRALSQQLPRLRLQVPIGEIVWARSHADVGPKAVPVIW